MKAITIAALMLGLAGCGSSAEQKNLDQFVGQWEVTTGDLTIMCATLPLPNANLAGSKQPITLGTDSDLVMGLEVGAAGASSTCNIKLDVTGTVASVRPGQTCRVSAMGLTIDGVVTSGTFSVTGDTAAFSYAGTFAACSFAGGGSSKRP